MINLLSGRKRCFGMYEGGSKDPFSIVGGKRFRGSKEWMYSGPRSEDVEYISEDFIHYLSGGEPKIEANLEGTGKEFELNVDYEGVSDREKKYGDRNNRLQRKYIMRIGDNISGNMNADESSLTLYTTSNNKTDIKTNTNTNIKTNSPPKGIYIPGYNKSREFEEQLRSYLSIVLKSNDSLARKICHEHIIAMFKRFGKLPLKPFWDAGAYTYSPHTNPLVSDYSTDDDDQEQEEEEEKIIDMEDEENIMTT